ncbi:MAG: hypothetical protein HY731_06335 [Candidatus Tectomicrobia bacterium]|nr:hypothetical protein [Candidatus Tectomicrobia bacterium]
MPTEITKPTTIKSFLKENTQLRISTEAIPAMLEGLTVVSLAVVQKAEELTQAEGRTTLLDRDIAAAFKELSGIEQTPHGLFKAVEKIAPEEIGKLSLLIAEWVKEHRKNLGISTWE